MLALIVGVAEKDERIRAVLLGGSRTDPDTEPDRYQDFDAVYFVRDVTPFWDNEAWIEEQFGKPALLQKPESMRLTPPDGDGNYAYLMLFPLIEFQFNRCNQHADIQRCNERRT